MMRRIPKQYLTEPNKDVPHITVKYGLHTQDPKPVASVLKGSRPVRFKLGRTSLFSPEGKEYDVVKVDVESPDLQRLNAKLRAALKATDTFPTYKPHVTVAYVKRGLGQQVPLGRKSSMG